MTRPSLARALVLALFAWVALTACRGAVDDGLSAGDPGAPPTPPTDGRDAGAEGPVPFDPDCASSVMTAAFVDLEKGGCVRSECHGPVGGAFPDLLDLDTLVGLQGRAGQPMVSPGNPSESLLFQVVSGDLDGRLMPLGAAEPVPEVVAAVSGWIEGGATSACGVVDPPGAAYLPQDALFTCADPGRRRASLARMHRLDQREAIHGMGGFTFDRPALESLPFSPPAGEMTTFGWGTSLDSTTLSLYLDTLPRALRETGPPMLTRCMSRLDDPDEACRDGYVDELLREHVLFRTATAEEHAVLRGILDGELAREDLTGGRDEARRATATRVREAAWLLPGALLRSEQGTMADAERLRLTPDELRLALTSVLTPFPPTLRNSQRNVETPRAEVAWLAGFETMAADGVTDDEWNRMVRDVFDVTAGHVGGVDPRRLDVVGDYARNNSGLENYERRGDFWLAPRLMEFFREYFDYADFAQSFKTRPAETSRWEEVDDAYEVGQLSRSGEPRYGEALDDTIARAVVESELRSEDVFHALLTTRLYRLPATELDLGPVCDADSDCTEPFHGCRLASLSADGVWTSRCMDRRRANRLHTARVFDHEPMVPATEEGRWVTLPEGARAGVLTHPVWLGAHGGNFEDEPSAVLRGYWIREHLFCEDVPGLDNVSLDAALVPQDEANSLSARERIFRTFEGPESDPRCAGCHVLMNPLGLPFEIYNHAGFLRSDDHGAPPNGTATIPNWPVSETPAGRTVREVAIADGIQLAEELAADPCARRCFVRHVFRYFLGRRETAADACTLADMETAFEGGSFMQMLAALVASDTFVYRTVEVQL